MVIPGAEYPPPSCRQTRTQRQGCVQENLCPVSCAALRRTMSPKPVHAALLNAHSILNKMFVLNDLISSQKLDLFMLTETWLKPGDNSAFSELLPSGYSFLSAPVQRAMEAAFDTVDHSILLNRLAQQVGFQGPVLQWFKSCLTERHFSVFINGHSSSTARLSSGVPQGSILGPNQLLRRGLSDILDQILVHSGDDQLIILADMWEQFFTEILPTLQAIFYPVQGQELTVRQMALLAFRDLVLLKLHLQETLGAAARVPPHIIQMLLVLQGVHESSGPSLEYHQLERLLELVVSPYLSNVLHSKNQLLLESRCLRTSVALLGNQAPLEITVTQHHNDQSSLAPLVEQDGEAYLEKSGGLRRHTVANMHSDVRLLSLSARMHAGTEETCDVEVSDGAKRFLLVEGTISSRPFSSQADILESPRSVAVGGVTHFSLS
ncbi:proline-rich protein 5-like [Thalassophryne amazonica]|uniref:proline-rich protein 5-like n=1 Tax=Thalassophryne amazonica TaxID=390379 RepID=UPI0014720A75|nr:proline-rich protein 5-like [Thalassophryne amazonica]